MTIIEKHIREVKHDVCGKILYCNRFLSGGKPVTRCCVKHGKTSCQEKLVIGVSAAEHVTGIKRGKTCYRVSSAGKQFTGRNLLLV